MHGAKSIMGWMLLFVCLSLLSYSVDEIWYPTQDAAAAHALTSIMSTGAHFGGIVTAAGSFFTVGLAHMIVWDYSWLTMNSWGPIVRFILFTISSIGFVWTLIMLIFPVLAWTLNTIGGGILSLFRRWA